eukprot:8016167-Ditylum_brightwellii.AAC.1
MIVIIAEKRVKLLRTISLPNILIYVSHELLKEKVVGMDAQVEDKVEAPVALVASNSSLQNQCTQNQEKHISFANWKCDHGTDTNQEKCPSYKPSSKTSRAHVAAAEAQSQLAQDNANPQSSVNSPHYQGDVPAGTVAAVASSVATTTASSVPSKPVKPSDIDDILCEYSLVSVEEIADIIFNYDASHNSLSLDTLAGLSEKSQVKGEGVVQSDMEIVHRNSKQHCYICPTVGLLPKYGPQCNVEQEDDSNSGTEKIVLVPEGYSEPDGLDQQNKVAPELYSPSESLVRHCLLRSSRNNPVAHFQEYQTALVSLCNVMTEDHQPSCLPM